MDQRQRHDSHSIEPTADAHTIASAASPRAWSVCRHASPKMIMMTKNGRVKEGNVYVFFFREKPPEDFYKLGQFWSNLVVFTLSYFLSLTRENFCK